jgi:NADH dehydrogenase FAD-containing subunit
VVVVGGGFAGRKVAMKLQYSCDVTLVDTKDHFLCVISLPSCICDLDHLDKVSLPHSHVRARVDTATPSDCVRFGRRSHHLLPQYLEHCTILVDQVVGLVTGENTLLLKSHGPLFYDYLVLCTGSRYRVPVQGNDELLVIDPLYPSALRE